jgi:hypothetical protein
MALVYGRRRAISGGGGGGGDSVGKTMGRQWQIIPGNTSSVAAAAVALALAAVAAYLPCAGSSRRADCADDV